MSRDRLQPASASQVVERDTQMLRALLEGYEAPDPGGAQLRAEMLRALEVEESLDRGLPSHFVASAMIVHRESLQALLVNHPRFHRFQQPGGHLDGDADARRVAVREAYEETGLDHLLLDPEILDLDRFSHEGDRDPRAHTHLDLRFLLVDASSGEPAVPASPEGDELRWFALSELSETWEDESMRRLARAALERLG